MRVSMSMGEDCVVPEVRTEEQKRKDRGRLFQRIGAATRKERSDILRGEREVVGRRDKVKWSEERVERCGCMTMRPLR